MTIGKGMKLSYLPQSQTRKLLNSPQLLADACRINALYMVAKAGKGHLGTSFSSMEAIVAIRHLMEKDDLFLSSKGHDAAAQYAVLIAYGILDEDNIHRFRSGAEDGEIPSHPTTQNSGIVANTGSLGMGLSKAVGFAKHGNGTVYVLLGDGELAEGQNWEAALYAKRHNLSNIIAIVDCNGYGQDTFASMTERRIERMFEGAGWNVSLVKDGNKYFSVERAVTRARKIGLGPWAILLRTSKGFGISEFDGYAHSHSGPPRNYSQAVNQLMIGLPDFVRLRETDEYPKKVTSKPHPLYSAFGEALDEIMMRDYRVVFFGADTLRDLCVYPLKQKYKDRIIDVGISEQHMVSMASAYALSGWKPVVGTYARFLVSRANEQIYNQRTEGKCVVYVGAMAGPLRHGGPGRSHEINCDGEMMKCMDIQTFQPNTPTQLKEQLKYCLGLPQTSYLRLLHHPEG